MSSSNDAFKKSMENATAEIIERAVINMQTACLIVERDAKIYCPVDTGVLRSSIFSTVNCDYGNVTGIVASSSEIAPYVHQGTGIYAVNGDGRKTPWRVPEIKSGKYKGDGFWTVGQKPNPFLNKALMRNMNQISDILAGNKNG